MDKREIFEALKNIDLNNTPIDELTKLEIALQDALSAFRAHQNGANIHRTANILTRVQGMITRLETSPMRFFSLMAQFTEGMGVLFGRISHALVDARIDEADCCSIHQQIEVMQKVCDEMSSLCKCDKACAATCRFKYHHQ